MKVLHRHMYSPFILNKTPTDAKSLNEAKSIPIIAFLPFRSGQSLTILFFISLKEDFNMVSQSKNTIFRKLLRQIHSFSKKFISF